MRVLNRISLILVLCGLVLSASAFALDLPVKIKCADRLRADADVQRLTEILGSFEQLGLNTLLTAPRAGQVDAVFVDRLASYFGSVGWKNSLFGQRHLLVRDLKWSTPEERERAQWNVAVALYQMQYERRWLLFRSVSAADLDADMGKLADSFQYDFELFRGNTARYLAKLKRWIVAGVAGAVAGGTLQLGAYFFMPELLDPPASLPQVMEGLDPKLRGEYMRLKAELLRGVEGAQEELSDFCAIFTKACR